MLDDKREKALAAHRLANKRWQKKVKEKGYITLQIRILPKYKQQIKDHIKKLHANEN